MTEQPASADIELVLAFLNTVDVEEGVDTLEDEAGWRRWAAERGWTAERELGGQAQARSVRDALRAAVGSGETPAGVPFGCRLDVWLSGDSPVLVAQDALGEVLAAATRLAVLGQWDRVKICPADDCQWAFYDRSRNHSRTWCSMRVCGNREKARTFRGRTQPNA